MPASIAPAPLPGDVSSDDLLHTLLAVSLTGIILFRPVYDAAGDALTDFAYDYLNPAAQQMLRLPAQPAESFLTRFPMAEPLGIFAFYREAFLSGQPRRQEFNFQYDGLDGYFHLATQRQGPLLVVSFTDTNEQPRSAVEQALRQSQARERATQAAAEHERNLLQALLEQAPVAIALFQGLDVRIASANARMAALWGRTPEQVIGRTLLEAMPELTGQGFDEMIRQVQLTRVSYVGTEEPATLLHAGQLAVHYYDFTCQPVYDAQGELLGVLNVAVEVTEQVEARRALEQLNQELETRVQERTQEADAARQLAQMQQQRLEQLFMQAPAAICILDGPDLVYELVNPAYQQFFPGRALQGLPLLQALPELTDRPVWHTLQQVYRTGKTHQEVGIHIPVARTAGGPLEDFYFNYIQQARFNAQGQVDGAIVFAFDITEQIRASRQAEEAATELRLLTAHSPAFLFRTDAAGSLTYLNKEFFAWTGLDATQLRSLDEGWATVHPGDLTEQQPGFVAAVQAGQPWQSTPYRFRRADGHYRWMLSRSQPLFGAEGQVLGHTGLTFEVHEQVELQRQLARTNVDLDTFVYTASHDLKAPITNIEGLLTALRYQLPAEVQAEEMTNQMLEMMQGAVNRFRYTIDQLTDISRLQQAQAQPAEPVWLAAVVADAQLDLAPLLTSTGAQLTVEVGPDVAVLFAPKNLRSVVVNLLSNAVKYHHPARPPVVDLRATAADGQVVLTVSDNGLGMNASQQSRLFGLFQRLHTHVEGTGVGLYMVKRMVDNAGGSIAVYSEQEVGTTFTVTLPAASAS